MSNQFNRPYGTCPGGVSVIPAVDYWANLNCPDGQSNISNNRTPILKSVPFGLGGFPALFLILVSALSGCGSPVYNPYTHISEIKDRPQEYQDKQVLVKGKVVETFAIPFLQKGMYQMDDGTDEIWIVPQGRVPFRGEEVTVKGKVKTGFTIRKRTFGTVIVEGGNESKNTERK